MLSSFYLGTATAVIAALLFPQFDNYWLWLALRFIMGGALGLQWVVSESWINTRRGTILGIYIAVFAAGLALGPLMLSYTGSQGFLPFAVAAELLTLCGLPLPFARPAKDAENRHARRSVSSTLRIVLAENIAGFIHGVRYASSLALLPLYAIHLGSEPGRSLRFLTAMYVGSLIFQPISGRLIDRFSPRAMLLACGLVQVAFCAVLASAVSSDFLVWPLMLVWGASGGAMYTACITGLGAKIPTGDLPAATTGFLMVWQSGALLGPLFAGVAMEIWDPHGMAIVLAAFGGMLVLTSLRRVPVAQTS